MAQQMYQVILTQLMQQQVCTNVFSYITDEEIILNQGARLLVDAMGFTGLTGTAFNGGLALDLQGLQSENVAFTGVTAYNLYNLDDFYDFAFPPNVIGTQGGFSASPFVAYGFSNARVTRAIRPSQKRFAGVSATHVGSGGIIDASGAILTAAVASGLSEILLIAEEPDVLAFPCTFGKKKEAIPDTDPVRYRYVFYSDPEEQIENTAKNLVFTAKSVTVSQTSRRYGQGV